VGWDKNGRYYTRSRRVNGRVVREYVGGGAVGQLAASLDTVERDRRQAEVMNGRAEREAVAALDGPLDDLNELADLLAAAALVAAGFRQHNRGEWRKRRDEHANEQAV
jgi:hypothetical protein